MAGRKWLVAKSKAEAMNDVEDCELTYEQALAELETLENQLAAKYNLAEPVRQTLIEKISPASQTFICSFVENLTHSTWCPKHDQ